MAHPLVKQIEIKDKDYNEWNGPGWYFFDPEDDARLNIHGPYRSEREAEGEYYAYCSAAFC